MRYVNNSLHLAQKYARIFARRHYLFWEANSFARVKLEKNCELWGTDIRAIYTGENKTRLM